jgi:SOS-response transcriptional repressor LexA
MQPLERPSGPSRGAALSPDVDEYRVEIPLFEVSTERQAVKETSATRAPGGSGAVILPAIAVCDVDLTHQSHISDDEELRFQMGVAVYGYERDQHNRARVQADTSWFGRGDRAAAQPARFVPRIVRPTLVERYQNCLPLVPLKAAAGWFSAQQDIGEPADWQWIAIDTHHRLRRGLFVAQVVGKSMEPQIPDGAYCLFASPVEGTRHGKTVLVQFRDGTDPEHGGRYTVKRYFSERAASEDGSWRHVKIELKPNNADFDRIELTTDDEDSVKVVAEVLEVLG